MSVSCGCCVLSGRGLCVGLITRPEESYCVSCECDREASTIKRPWPTRDYRAMERKTVIMNAMIIINIMIQGHLQ
jgi:hypothetical protein